MKDKDRRISPRLTYTSEKIAEEIEGMEEADRLLGSDEIDCFTEEFRKEQQSKMAMKALLEHMNMSPEDMKRFQEEFQNGNDIGDQLEENLTEGEELIKVTF